MICKTTRGGLIEIRVDMLSDRPHNLSYYSLQGTKGCYEAARGLGDLPKIWLEEHSDQAIWQPLSDFEEQYIPEIWRNHLQRPYKLDMVVAIILKSENLLIQLIRNMVMVI